MACVATVTFDSDVEATSVHFAQSRVSVLPGPFAQTRRSSVLVFSTLFTTTFFTTTHLCAVTCFGHKALLLSETERKVVCGSP